MITVWGLVTSAITVFGLIGCVSQLIQIVDWLHLSSFYLKSTWLCINSEKRQIQCSYKRYRSFVTPVISLISNCQDAEVTCVTNPPCRAGLSILIWTCAARKWVISPTWDRRHVNGSRRGGCVWDNAVWPKSIRLFSADKINVMHACD